MNSAVLKKKGGQEYVVKVNNRYESLNNKQRTFR